MRPGLVLTFAAMGVATYLTRAPLLLMLARRGLPAWVERYVGALPIALLTALVAPILLLPGERPLASWAPQLPAAILVALLARRSRNLLLPVAAGVLLVAGLRALVG